MVGVSVIVGVREAVDVLAVLRVRVGVLVRVGLNAMESVFDAMGVRVTVKDLIMVGGWVIVDVLVGVPVQVEVRLLVEVNVSVEVGVKVRVPEAEGVKVVVFSTG